MNAVRFLVTDTNSADQLVQDEEIYWVLQQYPDVRRAAAETAQQIAMQFARKPKSLRATDTAVDYGTRAEQFQRLAAQLTRDAGLGIAQPYAGGLSIGEQQTAREDTDRVDPLFTRRLFETHPWHDRDEERS